jgi:hypothetical protein
MLKNTGNKENGENADGGGNKIASLSFCSTFQLSTKMETNNFLAFHRHPSLSQYKRQYRPWSQKDMNSSHGFVVLTY